MAHVPPFVPSSISMTVRAGAPKVTVADLERAKDREEDSLDRLQAERASLLHKVDSIDRQIANVKTSIEELEERIQGATALERMQYLEDEVERLKRELAEARNPRDGREFG